MFWELHFRISNSFCLRFYEIKIVGTDEPKTNIFASEFLASRMYIMFLFLYDIFATESLDA